MEMDKWGVDVLLAASQKGLMTPPGIAYCILGPRLVKEMKPSQTVSPYWDWYSRINPDRFYAIFGGTAPTHLLFAQREALDMLKEEGQENLFFRHEVLAKMIWSAVEHWGSKSNIVQLNVCNKKFRSHAVTTIIIKGHDTTKLSEWLNKELGVQLGISLGFTTEDKLGGKSVFRIGHMGHMNPHMVLGLIASIEAGLNACKIPHSPGATNSAIQIMNKELG
jgi:alanine-glyoxylate transaminase/serine-glyoxylate transaminase/serine-pyruvate transaminase